MSILIALFHIYAFAIVEHVDYFPAGCSRTACYPAGVEVHTNLGYYTGDLEDLKLKPGQLIIAPGTSNE